MLPFNPATAVRGPKHSAKGDKTPVLDPSEARQLLDSIDVSTPIGLRDRALIALMVYSFARVGAATAMKVEDVFTQNRRLWVRLHEKGGKRHEMYESARHLTPNRRRTRLQWAFCNYLQSFINCRIEWGQPSAPMRGPCTAPIHTQADAIAEWQTQHLQAGALARIAVVRRGAAIVGDYVLVKYPNDETRRLKPGPQRDDHKGRDRGIRAGVSW